jgi:hypothetical protein
MGGQSVTFSSGSQQFATDSLTVQAVPEPGPWALLVVGAAMAGIAARRARCPSGTQP